MLKADNELYKVASNKSREKCLRFFGEQSVPIHVGDGNSNKLKNFFVQRPSLTQQHTPAVEMKLTLTETSSIASSINTATNAESPIPRRYSMPSPASSLPVIPLVNKSTIKIQKVLGNTCPVDISLSEIEQNGLVSLLQSMLYIYTGKIPLCFFLAYLLENRIPEILFFITDVVEFESRVFESHEAQQSAAHMVFQLYLNKSSPLEANFTHKAKLACATQIKLSASRSCFEQPHKEAMVLLEEAYTGFKDSKIYGEMTAAVGNSQIHDKVAEAKVKRLVQKVLDSSYVLKIRAGDSGNDGAFLSDQDRLAKQVECVHRNAKLFVAKYAKRSEL